MKNNDNVRVQFGFKPRSNNWTSLRLLNIFRVGVAAIFFGQSFIESSPLVNIQNLTLYAWVSFAYLLLSLVMTLSAWIDRRNFQLQVSIQTYFDIIAIILLMHASGGISSGIGMLLIISIATSGLMGRDSLATVFASLASVGLLAEYVYSSFSGIVNGTSTQVGLLGAALFATALVTQTLTRRISTSEALIKQQKLDVANLAALNAQILQNMKSGVLALDNDLQVRHINDIARDMLQISGKIAVPFDTLTQLPDVYQALEHWNNDPTDANSILLSGGATHDIQINFHDMKSASHEGTLIFLDDVSKLKHQMQQSKLASLGQLTANIAHEIRNPLGAISHAGQLLAENQDLPDTDKRMTEIIQQHTGRINHIIEDIMQISRGRIANKDRIQLNEWLEHFIEGFCLSGEASTDCFELIAAAEDIEIVFDLGHLHRILTNLCSNAKNHGSQDLPVYLKYGRNNELKSFIEVADQGKGISHEEMDKIFEPFYTTSHKGSGLGLYIVSQLCELNDAQIQVTQNEYGGTSLTIIK